MSDKRRRKSLSMFRPGPSLTPLTTVIDEPSQHIDRAPTFPSTVKGKSRPISIFTGRQPSPLPSSPIADVSTPSSFERGESPKMRPRVLHKGGLSRNSVFGSLRSLRSLDDDDKLTQTQSKASSIDDEDSITTPTTLRGVFGEIVLHYGEVQTTGGVFRKKSQYLVLTDSHLIRFKSQAKAAEVFPVIPASLGRNISRQSMASVGSYHEMQSTVLGDITSGVALNQVIAVSKLDDGRPFCSIEIAHLDNRTKHAATMQMQLNDLRECDLWLMAIRSAAKRAKEKDQQMYHTSTLEHIARVLEHERDYDPEHVRIFPVVRRATSKSAGRSSMDDLAKLSSTVSYMAVGVNNIHLVPLQRVSSRMSSTSLSDLETPVSYGIMSLTAFATQGHDDAFQMIFRVPTRGSFAIHLASSRVDEIALCVQYRADYLRPAWTRQPFSFSVPSGLNEQDVPLPPIDEDHHCFTRTLIGYCFAYDLNPSRITYAIDYDCEDAPCFRLLPAAGPSPRYAPLELIAIMRTLRYNETFHSISFSGVNLDGLHSLYDAYGVDPDGMTTRHGMPVKVDGHEELSILALEIRALALKSRRLRRLDFTYCLTRVPEEGNVTRSNGCGIPEAVMPLCKRSLTNVDWLILNGIKLGESDLDYLVDAASERTCHLRALEVSNCGLSVHDIDVLLSTLAVQESTMEVINIAGVQGRISSEIFQKQIGYFAHIRRINLTRVQKTTGPEPLIAPETLLSWRLEELILSQTAITEQTLDSVAAYLSSPQSETLRVLHLDQCGLTGKDLAIVLRMVPRANGKRRPMHISANENRLHVGYSYLFDAIAQNQSPTHLTMRMIEFEKERHFRELVHALHKNITLVSLDISKASLPYDASQETCEDLQKCFAENHTLEELDISGDHSHLDAARFGIGLNYALTGLKANNSLKVLRIEYQNLGLQGANTLADVLEHNVALREVHCENNDITLQCFTALLNGLQKNRFLLYLPSLERDRDLSIEKVKREIQLMNSSTENVSQSTTNTLRRTLTLVGAKPGRPTTSYKSGGSVPRSVSTDQDVLMAVGALEKRWDAEGMRLHRYLMRNHCIATGQQFDESEFEGPNGTRGGDLASRDSMSEMIGEMKVSEPADDSESTPEDDLTMGYVEMNEKNGLDGGAGNKEVS